MITSVIFDIDGTLWIRSIYMPRLGERPLSDSARKSLSQRFVGKSARAEIS